MRFFESTTKAISRLRWIRSAKNFRNRFIDDAFRRSGLRARDAFLAAYKPNHDIVVFAIAFNTPWVIELLTTTWRKSVNDADLVVVDNSTDTTARETHRQICAAHGVAYLPLPKNPEWSAGRSHGIAMNWAYHNLVEKLRPKTFGFIDHDCFPTSAVSFNELIADKVVYGRKDFSAYTDDLWSLWAGFCFFRYDAVAGKPLDFKPRPEFGVDTGGGNWWPLYAALSPDQVGIASTAVIPDKDYGFNEEIIGDLFTHVRGASYRADIAPTAARDARKAFLWKKYLNVAEL